MALAQYGQQVVDRTDFARGRVKLAPANRLNISDFGGLFSGNAIAPARSYALRLTTSFWLGKLVGHALP